MTQCSLGIAAVLLCFAPEVVSAGPMSKMAKEAGEYVLSKFGKETAEEGVETLTRKIETLAVKYGDDAFVAVKKVGPRAFRLVDEAGENGAQSLKLMSRYGENAVWVVAKKNRMAIFLKYGDDAAEAMMKQGEIVEELIQSVGKPAASAFKAVSSQNARRLVMMSDDGQLAAIGKTPELLNVVAKYGDPAMDFIWNNKGALAVTAGLATFLAEPKPFLDGAKDITAIVAENVAKPIASVPAQVANEAAKRTNWTFVLLAVVGVTGLIVMVKVWLKSRAARLRHGDHSGASSTM